MGGGGGCIEFVGGGCPGCIGLGGKGRGTAEGKTGVGGADPREKLPEAFIRARGPVGGLGEALFCGAS